MDAHCDCFWIEYLLPSLSTRITFIGLIHTVVLDRTSDFHRHWKWVPAGILNRHISQLIPYQKYQIF